MFGWAGIAGTLLIASPAHGGAGLSLEQTTYIFAMVASTASFSPLLLGIVLDKYGPRFASLLSNIIIAVGIQTIALAESYTAFAIGACTVAFGGPGIQASVVSFANLFPNAQFFVMSIVNGSIAVSFAILPIFNQIWKVYGTSYQTMFQTYLLVVIASGIGSLLLLPDEPFQSIKEDDDLGDLLLSQQEEDDHTILPQTPPPTRRITPRSMKQAMSPEKLVMESVNHVNHLFEQPLNSFLRSDPSLERHESFMLSKKAIEKGMPGLVSLKDLPFMGQVTSGSYIRSLTVFVVTSFFANFYIAAITTEVSTLFHIICDRRMYTVLTFTFLYNVARGLCARVHSRTTREYGANLFTCPFLRNLGIICSWMAHGYYGIGNMYTCHAVSRDCTHGDIDHVGQCSNDDDWICHLYTLSCIPLSRLYCLYFRQVGFQILWNTNGDWFCSIWNCAIGHCAIGKRRTRNLSFTRGLRGWMHHWRMEVVACHSDYQFPVIGHSSHLGSSGSNASAGIAHGDDSIAK
jgi:MFS family permease